MKIKSVDLFCGAGGSSWGAHRAGAEIIAGVDSWDLATRTYEENFPRAQAVQARLTLRSGAELLPRLRRTDLLLASPECTNHTCARGGRDRDEESRETCLYVLNFAKSLRPRWLVIENVIQLRSWSGYADLLDGLRRHYCVSEQVLDAANFGVPQTRRRLFLICDQEHTPQDLTSVRSRRTRTAGSILDPRGRWPASSLFKAGRARATLERAERAIAELGRGVPFLLVYYGSDGAGGWQDLDRPLRTLTTLDRFGLVEWRQGAPTLRMLQIPELRRAMGFDTDFRLGFGTRRDKVKMLGNGVCPPVMEAIVRSLIARRS